MLVNHETFVSRHFELNQLSDGIYAAIQREEGWAVSNSGIIDMGERSLVFDTFLTVQAARDLRMAAEQLTGKPIGYVINSHYHNDHIWGNQVFDGDAQIISSEETLKLIKTEGKEEYNFYKENSATRLKELLSEYRVETDKDRNSVLLTWINYYQGLVETFPLLNIRLPTITFGEQMKIHGEGISVELIAFKGGHTGCDTVLHIPDKGILFMSDLLFVRCHPFLPDGNPQNLLHILDQINRLEAKMLVPGHGPVGTKGDLDLLREYILHCDQTGRQMVEEGKEDTEIPTYPIPDLFSDWILPNFYTANLRYFFDHYKDTED